ncbi:MAG: mannose-1-phosphate guanylyltransferase [Prevotellaceae bacterium]|nr:mannose-1-phosphate guanylyltransferase [Prevotellaceae bacterium]
MDTKIYCVILAGGVGMRLWPMSRNAKPKQFIDVLGTGKTLLQTTYERFATFIDTDNIIIVTNESYRQMVVEQLPGVKYENILMEPMRRNTVPAVTWASLEVMRRCPDGRLIVSPSDQNITDVDAFRTDVLRGLDFVGTHDVLLTLGAKPNRPAVSYGYIQMADAEPNETDIYKVRSFTEKPAEDFAKIFYESGEFLWNTGLFLLSAHSFLHAIESASTEFYGIVKEVISKYQEGEYIADLLMELFTKCPNLSLEQSVLEKAGNVYVMLCHFGWADIGTWEAMHNALPKSEDGNVVIDSKSLLYDCKDCIIKLPDGHVAVVQGLEDYIVVEEGNVLVICKKGDQKNIRKFVNDAQLNLGEEFV